MKKCKIFDQSDIEIATILIWVDDNHKVGLLLEVPYVANTIQGAYLIHVDDNYIITDLLNKIKLTNSNIHWY